MSIFSSATTPAAQLITGVVEFNCDSGAAINDAVEISTAADKTVIVLTSNIMTTLCIGFIEEKPTTTTCRVRITGLRSGFTGLTRGGIVWLDSSGLPTATLPTTGHRQVIGIAVSASEIFVRPDMQKVVLI